ncbi:MAG: hypothetical protein LBJ43_00800 [Propionibacteriaceae bacterium]|nr:hypothetical protein [Propionibacteriaceae bacterium]
MSTWLENIAPAYNADPVHQIVLISGDWKAATLTDSVRQRFGSPTQISSCPQDTNPATQIWTYQTDLKTIVNR